MNPQLIQIIRFMLAHPHTQRPAHLLEPVRPSTTKQPVARSHLDQVGKEALRRAAILRKKEYWKFALDCRSCVSLGDVEKFIKSKRMVELGLDLDNAGCACYCVE